jgi:hypothetical protein
MKYLSSAVVAGAMLLAVIPAFAINFSGAVANTGLNQINGSSSHHSRGGSNTIITGDAVALSGVVNVGSPKKPSTNVSVAVANTGLNQINGGGTNGIKTGNAMAGSAVVNFSSSFGGHGH